MDFLHLPSPSSSPKKLLWDLPEFAALDLKIHTAHAELRTLANKHAHRAAAEFVDREVEWELLEGEVFVEVDRVLHHITELYSKMRKNIKTAFNNIVRGVDFGLVHHSAHPTFQTDTPKTSTAKGARRDSASGGFGFDVRPKIVKKNSAEDVTAALDNVQLTATNEKFGVSGSSVIYHIEDMGQHPVVVTGCWGSIYDMDTETRKTRDLHLIEMRDYEIYNCHAIDPNLRVMFPYKNKPAVYCDELYCFSLPSVFQSGPSRCIASVNGYLFYTSTSNFNVVHYNLSKVKAMNAGGLPPNPVHDTLNLQAVVDICTSPIIPDTLFYLQPHQIGKIVFSKQTETWTVTDDAETTWSDPTQAQTPNPTSPNSSSSQLPYLGSNRILGASQSGRILVGGRDEPRQRNYLCLYDPQTLLMSPDTPTFFEKTDRLQKLLVFEHRGLEFVCVLDHARHVHLCVLGAGEPNRAEGGDRGRGIKLLPGGIAVVAKVDTQQAGECFTGFWCANREEILLGGSEFRMVLKLQF